MERDKQSGSTMTKEKMQEYFSCFNKEGDTKTFSSYYSEDAVFTTPWGREITGRDNIIKYMIELAHRGGKIKETLTPLNILIDGDHVAVEIETEMEALDDVPDFHMGGRFVKGVKIKWKLAGFYTLENGKFVRVQLYVVFEDWLRKWIMG